VGREQGHFRIRVQETGSPGYEKDHIYGLRSSKDKTGVALEIEAQWTK